MDLESLGVRGRTLTLPRNLMREEQRAEPRQIANGAGATLFIHGRANLARVVNISARGTMLETAAQVTLDEHVVVAFEGCTPVHAAVRWIGKGRVGLHFGRELVLA